MNTIKVDFEDLSRHTYTPVFTYCRKLIKEGIDPKTKLEVYRKDLLCLTIHSIENGAKLTVKDDPCIHFVKCNGGYEEKMPHKGTTSPPNIEYLTLPGREVPR